MPATSTRTFNRTQAERLKQFHSVTSNGVIYDEQLAGSDGMHFTLIREPKHTDADIEAAEDYLRRNRDVVGVSVATLVDQLDYMDREHRTVGMAEFLPIAALSDLKPGDKFICPKSAKYGGYLDGKTFYPILLTVYSLIEPYHICSVGNGSFAFDLCLKMHNPE